MTLTKTTGPNQIEVFEGNTLSVTCTISGLESLAGYTALLTIKDKGGADLLEIEGDITDLVVTFDILAEENNINVEEYDYEVTINDGINHFTVVQDIYKVKESIVY